MSELLIFIKDNYLNILIVILLISGILLFINIKGWDLNPPKPESKLLQEVTVETFDMPKSINDMETIPKEDSIPTSSDAFCQSYLGKSDELENACNRLTTSSCDQTTCCVRTNDGKCMAGGIHGPTYNVDNNGNLITQDNYYYLGKQYNI